MTAMICKQIISLRNFVLVVSYNIRKKSDWFMISLGT